MEQSVLLIKHGTVNSHGQTQNAQFSLSNTEQSDLTVYTEWLVLTVDMERSVLRVIHYDTQ